MSEHKKIVLTGVNGFVGSHTAAHFAQRGYDVHGIVRATSNIDWLADVEVTLHKTGLEDSQALSSVFEGAEAVVHIAGTVNAPNLEGYLKGNVELTKNVVEAMAACQRVPHLVYVSSIAAAGPVRSGVKTLPTDTMQPVSLYGKSKKEAELYLRNQNLVEAPTIIRPAIVYGERDSEFFAFIKTIWNGLYPKVGWGSPKYIDLIYVKDLAQLLELAAKAKTGDTYFATSGEEMTWDNIAAITGKALGVKYRTLRLPHAALYAAGFFSGLFTRLTGKRSVFDLEKAKEGVCERWTHCIDNAKTDLEYQPIYPLDKGLERTIAWCKQEGWLPNN